jgi:hypothetical protein
MVFSIDAYGIFNDIFCLLRLKGIKAETIFRLTAIGAVQLGLMYCFYFQSFRFLTVPEVLLSVFTNLHYVVKRHFKQAIS